MNVKIWISRAGLKFRLGTMAFVSEKVTNCESKIELVTQMSGETA